MRIYTKYVTRHLPCPCFSRNFVLFPLEKIHDVVVPYKHYANQPWNYSRCITTYFITILQCYGHCCQFCGISGINDLECRLEVIQGR